MATGDLSGFRERAAQAVGVSANLRDRRRSSVNNVYPLKNKQNFSKTRQVTSEKYIMTVRLSTVSQLSETTTEMNEIDRCEVVRNYRSQQRGHSIHTEKPPIKNPDVNFSKNLLYPASFIRAALVHKHLDVLLVFSLDGDPSRVFVGEAVAFERPAKSTKKNCKKQVNHSMRK